MLITAELPPEVLAWADGLRRAHYPAERNRLRAHVTLFHALPPSSEPEVRRLLVDLATGPPPAARVTGLMNLGRGTALNLSSPGMITLRERIAHRLQGLLTRQDLHEPRLHITVQNKVTAKDARRLQAQLASALPHTVFHFVGFGLYAWEKGLWRPIRDFSFRGLKPA